MKYDKGIVGVGSDYLARYRVFDICLSELIIPEKSKIHYEVSNSIAFNWNQMCREVLRNDYQWLWIIGDDHIFNKNILITLLKHDVDVVVPICLQRSEPHLPFIYKTREDGYEPLGYDFLKNKKGLIDITGYCTSNAGMLIKRHVLEKIDAPWFENDTHDKEVLREDLIFCEKLKPNNFRLYMDLEFPMGHIVQRAVWPVRDAEYEYSHKYTNTDTIFNKNTGRFRQWIKKNI